jgi:hypothetical protein
MGAGVDGAGVTREQIVNLRAGQFVFTKLGGGWSGRIAKVIVCADGRVFEVDASVGKIWVCASQIESALR